MMRPTLLAFQLRNRVNKLFDVVRLVGGVRNIYLGIPALLLVGRHSDALNLDDRWSHAAVDRLLFELGQIADDTIHSQAIELEYTIRQLNPNVLGQLQYEVEQLELLTLAQPEFKSLFDYAIERAFYLFNGRTGDLSMPSELLELMVSIYEIRPGMNVYNPYAGTAALISYLDKEVLYVGQEHDASTRFLASLRLVAHQRSSATLYQGSSTESWGGDLMSDIVLCGRPVLGNRSATPSVYTSFNHDIPADIAFIYNVLEHISSQGRAIIPVAAGFLWQSSATYQRFRKHLAESGMLEAVLEFPGGMLPGSTLRLALLLLNAKHTDASQVLLVDAESFVQRKGRQLTIDTQALLSVLAQPNQTPAARAVAVSDLAVYEYSLSPRRYLVPLEPTEKQARLRQLTKLISTRSERQLPVEARFLRIRNLKADGVDYTLTTDEVPIEEITERRALIPLAQSALLIALQGNSLKPTWYEHQSGQVVYLPHYILPLAPSLSKVELAYLITELNSDFVRKQVYALSTGAVMPAIRKADVLSLIIRLPSRREQEEVVAEARSQVVKAALDEVQIAKERTYTQFAALKHALGTPLQTLSSGLKLLERAIDRYAQDGQVLTLDSLMNPDSVTGTTVQHTLNMMKEARKFMFDTIRQDEAELRVKSYLLQSVEIVDYIKQKAHLVQASDPGFTVGAMEFFTVLGDEEKMWGQLKVYVQANYTLLNRLFDNVLDNAMRHGFRGKRSVDNKVLIWMSLDNRSDGQSFINISIHNNGVELPFGWEVSRLFVRGAHAGSTGRSGIGGYEAKEIVDYFNGTIEVRPSAMNNFTVCYTIALPISETERLDVDDLPSTVA